VKLCTAIAAAAAAAAAEHKVENVCDVARYNTDQANMLPNMQNAAVKYTHG
jgi:hypothetical protein